ncbi:hypothetical protein MLD38_009805 [Melastoma candidum]|uniref:Uncharacterized protein n=1 Tax=Melastoma candidum TaxID=119954 RepID=A0ACB9S326_9MYRT|nr:hypothetical protein MLD38_009805 [Melastoma candidum]
MSALIVYVGCRSADSIYREKQNDLLMEAYRVHDVSRVTQTSVAKTSPADQIILFEEEMLVPEVLRYHGNLQIEGKKKDECRGSSSDQGNGDSQSPSRDDSRR